MPFKRNDVGTISMPGKHKCEGTKVHLIEAEGVWQLERK